MNSTNNITKQQSICEEVSACIKGITSSRFFCHILIASGVALAVFFLVTPPGWTTLGIGALAGISGMLTFLAIGITRWGLEKKIAIVQPFEIEVKNTFRKGINQNEISIDPPLKHKIHIGTIPNRRWSDLQELQKLNIKTVISVTHPTERRQIGFTYVPYTLIEYQNQGISLTTIDAPDHTLLTVEQMSQSNQLIKNALELGNVYVHCQGGKGRSAQAIAAYLIGTEGKEVNEVINIIKKSRKESTIHEKTNALDNYKDHLNNKKQRTTTNKKNSPSNLLPLNFNPQQSEKSLPDAIEKVKSGEKPFAFAQILTNEEQSFFDSLSDEKVKCIFAKIFSNFCFFQSDKSISDTHDVIKGSQILEEIKNKLEINNIKSFPNVLNSKSFKWHTDGGSLNTKGLLRMTFAVKGGTTQFFAPSKDEHDEFIKKGYKLAIEEVEKIAKREPTRVTIGEPYSVCIFHRATIHRGDLEGGNDRILLTMDESKN